ncbi:MAG TPA: PIN domain-containing protein [Thermoanaerobaculia bacterium]
MIAYLDSSVVLRIILNQENRLAEWDDLHEGICSPLLAVECHRTLDRFWREDRITDADLEAKRVEMSAIMKHASVVPLNERVLDAASQPMPTIIAALDAIHLASAILYRAAQPENERPLLFATHDNQLATAARAMHFEVIGA